MGEIIKFDPDSESKKHISAISMTDMEKMARAITASNFFGIKSIPEALALMLIAQSEGRHPASVAQDYHIIQGRPALKSDAMLSRYQAAGGRVEWTCMTDECVSAKFTHPSSGTVEISWDMKRAASAELLSKGGGMFKKYPRQMLRSRVVSEGVRASFPGVLGGMYAPEEVQCFDNPKESQEQPREESSISETEFIDLETKVREIAKERGWKKKDVNAFASSMLGHATTLGTMTKSQTVEVYRGIIKSEEEKKS